MLTQCIQAALRHAKYELMENGRFFAKIPDCPGFWAEGPTLEECREELQSALEDWIMIKLRHGDRFEGLQGADINPQKDYVEAD